LDPDWLWHDTTSTGIADTGSIFPLYITSKFSDLERKDIARPCYASWLPSGGVFDEA